jgi:hypothetical protein
MGRLREEPAHTFLRPRGRPNRASRRNRRDFARFTEETERLAVWYRSLLVPGLRSVRTLLLCLASATAALACNAETSGSSSAGRAKGGGEAAEPGYTLDVELPPRATRGQESIAHVRVHPKAPWHMNLEYPAKLQLRAPADVELVAPLLRKGDAERFDDQALEFAVLFTPQGQGSRKIQAELDFAVCGDAACGPVTESIELAFEVGCRIEDTGIC